MNVRYNAARVFYACTCVQTLNWKHGTMSAWKTFFIHFVEYHDLE